MAKRAKQTEAEPAGSLPRAGEVLSTSAVKAVMKEFTVPFAIVASDDGSLWKELGDISELTWPQFARRLLPGPESMPKLGPWFRDQPQPVVFCMGDWSAVTCCPRDFIVALFLRQPGDVIQRVLATERMASRLEELLAQDVGPQGRKAVNKKKRPAARRGR